MRTCAVLVSLVACATAVRWPYLGDSLWLDELHTSWVVAGDWTDVTPRSVVGNQSPLWFFGTKGCVALSGESEWALRLPSVLAGWGLIGVGFWSVVAWTGNRWAGAFAAFLLGLDRYAVFYATEARPYATVQFLAVLHIGLLAHVVRSGTHAWRAARIANLACLFYLHYSTALFLVAESLTVACAAWRGRDRDAYRLSQCLADSLLVMGLTCGALPWVLDIIEKRRHWEEFVPRPGVRDLGTVFPLVPYMLIPGIFAVWTRPGAGGGSARCRSGPDLPAVLAGLMGISLGLAWMLAVNDVARIFFGRYLVAATVLGPLFAAAMLARLSTLPERHRPWASLLLVLSVLGGLNYHEHFLLPLRRGERLYPGKNQDWRGALRFVREQFPTHPFPLALRSGLMEVSRRTDQAEFPEDYLLFPLRGLYHIGGGEPPMYPLHDARGFQLTSPWREQVERAGGLWVVFNGRSHAPAQIATALVRANWPSTPDTWGLAAEGLFGDIRVVCLQRREASEESVPAGKTRTDDMR